MIPDYKALAAELNAGRVSLGMFDVVLADYELREYGTRRGNILPFLLAIMTRLHSSNQRDFTFEWFRGHIEPPTHVAKLDDGNWSFLYRYSEDHIGMVETKAGLFDSYGRFCWSQDPETFWTAHTAWDNQIEWKRHETGTQEPDGDGAPKVLC